MSAGSAVPPRRVLLVEEGGLGGVARYTDALAQALSAAGWRVELATGADHPAHEPEGVRVRRLFPYVRDRTPLGRALRALRLSRPLNGLTHLLADLLAGGLARGSDVVHTQGGEWPPLAAAQALILRASGRPLIFTPHNTFDRGAHAYARSYALLWRAASAIVVHSEHDRSCLPQSAASKTVVIPHGEYEHLARGGEIDAQSVRAQLGIDERELVVLLFGQLRPDKGVRDLLEAAALVPGVHVLLAGEELGALEQCAELLADERLRGRVTVQQGFVEDAQASRLFAASDVAALPYRRASASGVLALAYGHAKPVVVYPVGGLPEYVQDGRTGWICERADAEALRERLQDVLEEGREQCRLRGQAALVASAELYSWPSVARRTIELYESTLR